MKTLLEEVLKFDNKENRALPLQNRILIAYQTLKLVEARLTAESDKPQNRNNSLQTYEVVYGLRIALELTKQREEEIIDDDIEYRAGFLGGLCNRNKSRGEHIQYIPVSLDDKNKINILIKEIGGK